MNKFNSRINRLRSKTCGFLSDYDQCLVRKYFKIRFEESELPMDFEERYEKYIELIKSYFATDDKAARARIIMENLKVKADCEAIRFKYEYQKAARQCDEHPNGCWYQKNYYDYYAKLITEAKNYFKSKQIQG